MGEQRPLRETQLHYALTLAWAPLMILRTHCAYQVVKQHDVRSMALQVGATHLTGPTKWDDILKSLRFCSEGYIEHEDTTEWERLGEYATNSWVNKEWIDRVPTPDRNFNIGEALERNLANYILAPEVKTHVDQVLSYLFDYTSLSHDMDSMYKAFHEHVRPQAAGQAEK